jgi:acetolactate synthase-1/2/3 large subunit
MTVFCLYMWRRCCSCEWFKSITTLAKTFQLPVTTTLMGKSSYNEKDHLSLGMLGCMGQLMPIMLLVNVI